MAAEDRAGVETILEMANRIGDDLKKLSSLDQAPSVPYLGATSMVDVGSAAPKDEPVPDSDGPHEEGAPPAPRAGA